MKVVITGHTSGIGEELFKFFELKNFNVVGFSTSSGYNISNVNDQKTILNSLLDADIFVNNAYNNFDDSQLILLKSAFKLWQNLNKTIINISSRSTFNLKDQYSLSKYKQDRFCESQIHNLPRIINIKPGLVDTPRIKGLKGSRMTTQDITSIIDFILSHPLKISSITFGK